MAMTENDSELERMFATARNQRDMLPDHLKSKILAEATAVQTALSATENTPARRRGILRQINEALGGWTGLGGLATTCAAGVWIGLAPPDFLPDPVGLIFQQQIEVDLLFGVDDTGILTEDG